MRKYFIFATALLLAACTKEVQIQQETENNQEPISEELVTYTISATIDATKAYIDDSTVDEDGISPLKWEKGDQIALKSGDSYTTFKIEEDGDITDGGTKATFKASAAPGKVFSEAYYPADYRGQDVATYYATKYSSISLTDSKKSFAMEATVGEGASSIVFSQKGSLVRFAVSNVPAFTRTAKLVAGSLTETVAVSSSEASTGAIQAFFAVPASASENLTFSLLDDAATPNTFYTKTRNGATINSASLYRYRIALRSCIEFTSAGDIAKVGIQQRTWNNEDYDYTGYGTYQESGTNFNLLTRGTTKYFILPEETWTESLEPIRIVIFGKDSELSSTPVVFARNLSFDASANTMKTSYAIFPYNKNSSLETPTCYVYLPAQYKLYMDFTSDWVGDLRIHCWDGSEEVWKGDMTAWDNDPTVTATETIGSTTYHVYTFDDRVDDKTFNIIFRIGGSESETKTLSYKNYAIHLFGKVKGVEGTGTVWTPDTEKTVYRTRLNGDWPGKTITKMSTKSTSTMISIASTYYGQTLKVKFSDNGTNVYSEWSPVANRDWDYGY